MEIRFLFIQVYYIIVYESQWLCARLPSKLSSLFALSFQLSLLFEVFLRLGSFSHKQKLPCGRQHLMFIYFIGFSPLGSLQMQNISEKRKIWFLKVRTPLILTCAYFSLGSMVQRKQITGLGIRIFFPLCGYVSLDKLFYLSDSVSLFVRHLMSVSKLSCFRTLFYLGNFAEAI